MSEIYCWVWTDDLEEEALSILEWIELDNLWLHRLDGPAVEFDHGEEWWFVNGKALPHLEVEEWMEENDVDIDTKEGQMAFKLMWS